MGYLIHARSDIMKTDDVGWTAAHEAAFADQDGALSMLINSVGEWCCGAAETQLTPLHVAAAEGHLSCVRVLLVKQRALLGVATSEAWRPKKPPPASHIPGHCIRREELLLERSGVLQRQSPDGVCGGILAHHLAAGAGRFRTLEELLHARADVNQRMTRGHTALHLCVKRWTVPNCTYACKSIDYEKVLRVLLNAGADARGIADGREGPLHSLAFHWGSTRCDLTRQVASTLLDDAGAELDARGKEGGTPLHWAVNGRNLAAVELLLERRANPMLQNNIGRSVVDLPTLSESEWIGPHGDQARRLLDFSVK